MLGRGGIVGRRGARRRTRRRMSRRTAAMLSSQQQAQIQQQSGKPISQMSDDEIENSMEKAGIEGPDDNELEQLEKLGDLKDKGLITDAEFDAKKKQILK